MEDTNPDSSNSHSKPPEERKRKLSAWLKGWGRTRTKSDDSLREAIEELIDEEETSPQSAVALHERRLISNILQLRDLPVVDVMVPRADIVAVDLDTPHEELIELLSERPHSRLPVYQGDLDNIVGVVHIKDMLATIAAGKPIALKDIMREVLVISPSMRVMDLLLQLRQSHGHIAFVIDEFGGIDGLITINDLIEAIVGEIDDEYTFELEPQMIERPDGSAIADARYPIEEFEAVYGNIFAEDDEDEDVETLGGLITAIAGYVPARGEIIRHESSNIEFEIVEADPRRVIRVRIRNLPSKDSEAASSHE